MYTVLVLSAVDVSPVQWRMGLMYTPSELPVPLMRLTPKSLPPKVVVGSDYMLFGERGV